MMEPKMQIGFYFDQSRCTGCYSCVAACRSWNELPPESPDLIRLVSWEVGTFPNVSLRHLLLTCFHCSEPACAEACPEELIKKRDEDGRVFLTDVAACDSCRMCQEACPYEAPQFDSDGGSVMLCSLCVDRLAEGNKPACVISCAVEALDIGPLEELVRKYGDIRSVSGFADPAVTRPSIIFKSKG